MIQSSINKDKESLFTTIKYAFDTQDYNTVIELCPEYMKHDENNPWIYAYFGYVMGCTNHSELAESCLKKALMLAPDGTEFLILIGKLLRNSHSIIHGIKFLTNLSERTKHPGAYYNLGMAYINVGETEKGIDLIIKAIELEPNLKYLEDLNQFIYYDPRFKNPDYIKYAQLFYSSAKEQLKIEPFKHNPAQYNKQKPKLKIGFFNAEGFNSPTWNFLEKIFKNIDRNRFSIHCYSRPPQQRIGTENKEIERIQKIVDTWELCHLISVKGTAQQIYNDEIDILIDLSGYLPSSHSYFSIEPNMCVFMYKPAPVQITWYGFWGTTGIPEIDYLITVAENIPESQDHNFTEKIYRLKNGYTHSEIFTDIPEQVNEPPCIKNGYITFASFSRVNKLNSHVYKTWSEILKQVPNSKLLIKYTMQEIDYTCNLILSKFEQEGISKDRIIIDYNAEAKNKFIAAYNAVDIALEPIPFGGVTTTINALSMGVPVIAKREEDRVINGGTCGLLRAIGCENLSATTEEEYINNAVKLANDIESLKAHRKNLRKKILNSSINAEQYTKDLVEAFEFIWQDACKNKGSN